MIHTIFIIIAILYSFKVQSILLIILSLIFLGIFIFSVKKFKTLKNTLDIAITGTKKSYLLVFIFALLGALSASWFISGTIPALIYYGIKIINPNYFYVFSFLITSLFSFLIGSSFGTVGTIGLVMVSLARGVGLDIYIVAGSIISGAYFGDRGSPMSSSANFVSILTETEIYSNVKGMFKASILPYLITLSLYFYLGRNIESKFIENNILTLLNQNFYLDFLVFIPMIYLVIMCLLKKNIRHTILVSIFLSLIIGWFLQNYEDRNFIKVLIYGFKLPIENELYNVIRGGGIFSMGTAMVMALLSCGLVNIVDKLGILKLVSEKIGVVKSEWKIYLYTIVVAILTAAISCSQSTSILLTSQIMKKIYKKNGFTKELLALDIENSSVVLSSLIPWNIAITVPALMLDISAVKIIPYSLYLFILPMIVMILKIKKLSQ
ncbi:putative Na+/H+ antiporter NhaC [Cetobacterium somerae ATCC BAA-474]|uniref:Putative Na+/H+ antiporter NhaC n=1 Tax=Cetobacterium somerae ATCC BAA-474 TaxID=1319815 RepID=U7V8P7_9FUSO|nr:Na+/H+ antiporter NhaC family protein [Cetobacterium somerae]ERT67881.1 putative Na+/H+ antiporter NhaC [Cetobacterium somerae ATCC BAA-474]